MTSAELKQAWMRFWFASQSPASLCVLRIGVGFIALCSLLLLIPDAHAFFSRECSIVWPVAIMSYFGPRFGLICNPETFVQVQYVLYGSMVSSFLLMIGFATPLSALLTFIGLVSLDHRQPLILNSGDTLLRLSALFLIFSPGWRMYSVDSWIARKFFKVRPDTLQTAEVWTQRMFQLQIALIYCVSFFSKLEGTTWLNGTAVYYATQLSGFQKFSLPWLLMDPLAVALLTWGTLAVEFSMFTLVWLRDIRYRVLLAALCLHLGIDFVMNIPCFEWLMMFCLLSFVDGRDVERAFGWVKTSCSRRMSPKVAVVAEAAAPNP